MKIVVALNNEYIKEKLTSKYLDKVYKFDIIDMESVLEFLSSKDSLEGYVVITKYNLSGNLTDKMYIKQLRSISKDLKIIYFIENLTDEYKDFLFANEVFNIIEGETANFSDIVKSIEESKKIVYLKSEDSSNKVQNKIINTNKILPKQTVAIFGTSGSGKSYIASILAKQLAKDLNIKVSLLDMDIQNPCIDILNSVDGSSNILNELVEKITRKDNISLSEYLIRDKNLKNVYYMTNNSTIFDCQNKLSNVYYEKILKDVISKFNYTFIDLPSSPFFDVVQYSLINCTKIFFVINPNYPSLRQAKKYLELINKIWAIPFDKVHLIVNKKKEGSLDKFQIRSILKNYDIDLEVNYNVELEGVLNGNLSSFNEKLNLANIYKFMEIQEVKRTNNYSIKNNLINTVKEKIINNFNRSVNISAN